MISGEQMRMALLVVYFTLFTGIIFAVPPAPGISPKGMPKDSVKKRLAENELKALGYSPAQIKKALSTALGTKKLAVVFVNFSDVKFTEAGGSGGSIATYVTPAATSGTITTQAGLLKKLCDYIAEVSYGKMTLEITPFTATSGNGITLSNTEAYYGQNSEANVVNGKLFKDAVSLAGSSVNSTSFDALMVVHAGTGEETSGTPSNIWSVFVEWDVIYGNANGFKEAETVPGMEKESYSAFGVLCHEFGHQLGLPDLYQTISPYASRVGEWDLMDYGAWTNKGANPPHFSSWCKALIGWITPIVQTSSVRLTLNAYNDNSANCYKVPIFGSSIEYFLFEYRRKSGDFDGHLPGEGVLIWHINDAMGTVEKNDVNNSAILRVYLVEKDNDANAGSTKGEAADAFSLSGDLFTSPQSDSYTDGPSKITLSEFLGSGTAAMTAKLFAIPATVNMVFNKMFNYPNPVKNALSSTIRTVFSRNVTTATLRLYTVSGELVIEKALAQNDALSSSANEWIYEYVWDLRNSDGAAVGSGIYFYVVSAKVNSQTKTKTGKLAIIR